MDPPIRTRPNLARKVWTPQRKLMGNLVPFLISLPFGVLGAWQIWRSGEFFGWGLAVFSAFPVIAWVAVNYLGLFENKKMRREMQSRLRAARPTITERRFFVGVATPHHRGLLDPHEDVGYLILCDDHLDFFGEKLQLQIQRDCISNVKLRPNPHSLVGLGRWISVEGRYNNAPIRLNIELREKDSLLANRILGSELKKRIEVWAKEKDGSEA